MVLFVYNQNVVEGYNLISLHIKDIEKSMTLGCYIYII